MLSNYKNQVGFRIIAHILIWILLLLFPFLLSHSETESIDYIRQMKFTWIPMFFYAVIFYCNYFILIDKFLFSKKAVFFFFINLVLILLLIWIHFVLRDLLNMVSVIKPDRMPPRKGPPMQLLFYKDLISMIIPIIIAFAVKTTEQWARTESEKKEREKDILNSELQHLKYQLQPHFFFNSLNTIYALIERSPAIAQETVHNLAKLMRYMLYETDSGKAALNDEIEFMKQYIDLMKLRVSDKTKVNMNFPIFSERHEITPLLFISLIENAFKHGISATQPSEIFFSLNVIGNNLRFFAENTNFPKNEKDKSGSGIGLINLKKRLELSYPGKYHFKTKIENNVYSVLLEIDMTAA
jgi:LytS/YehU family sensor histidine kinase